MNQKDGGDVKEKLVRKLLFIVDIKSGGTERKTKYLPSICYTLSL